MANQFKVFVSEDGPKNTCFKVDVSLDSGDLDYEVIWDPYSLARDAICPTNACSIDEIQFAVQDGLVVGLFWDAPTPSVIVHLDGRGKFPVDWAGGLPNDTGQVGAINPNSGLAGVPQGGNISNPPAGNLLTNSGRMLLSTFGWIPGQVMNASLF